MFAWHYCVCATTNAPIFETTVEIRSGILLCGGIYKPVKTHWRRRGEICGVFGALFHNEEILTQWSGLHHAPDFLLNTFSACLPCYSLDKDERK